MKKLIILILAGTLMITQSCSVKEHIKFDTGFLSYDEKLNDVINKYDSYFNELNVGLAAVVIKDNTLISGSAGQGSFDKNTKFNIGSATKKLTAILLLQEVEKGNVNLSDSIGTYLSPIANVNGSLTIESLLRHQSGLGELVGRNAETMFFSHHDSLYTTNFLDKIPASNPDQEGVYEYCNTNYILLGHIVEKITDRKYFDLLRERIFVPCQMENSYPYLSKIIENLAAPTHNGKDVSEHIDTRFFGEFAYSAGSVVSSLNDMAVFYKALFEDKTILSESSLESFLSFGQGDYGLGVMKIEHNETEYYGHGGNNVGYAYREYYNPKTHEMVLYFSNTLNVPFGKKVKKDLLDFVSNNTVEPTASIPEQDFTSNLGTYFFKEMDMELSLLQRESQLFINVQGMDILMMDDGTNILVSSYFGISLEKNTELDNTLVFRQNGMEAKINKIN